MATDLRCIVCRQEFISEECPDATGCPNCGDTGLPADPRTDQLWELLLPEWEVVLILARWWEEGFSGASRIVPVLGKVIHANDITNEHGFHPVTLSSHEIRVLTFWASSQLLSMPANEHEQTFESILSRLHAQSREKITLTLYEEVEDLRDAGYEVELREGTDGE